MVYKIEDRWSVFIESLILTILIFLIGFSIGFYIEYARNSNIEKSYGLFEVEALDLKLQNYYYQAMDKSSCEEAIKQNYVFADNLYDKGLIIERYEEANQITDSLLNDKKKYVLLKTELWLNTILLKEKCSGEFDTIVYLYSSDSNNAAIVAEQQIISNVLKEIKDEKGNNVILLPIAGDLGLNIVDLQMRIYKIKSLPSIMINEEVVLEGYHSKEEIEGYLRN